MLVWELSGIISDVKRRRKRISFLPFLRDQIQNKYAYEQIGVGCVEIHEEIERQIERLELRNEASNRVERAKIKRHNNDLRIRKLGNYTRLGILGRFHVPSREYQSRPLLRQHSRCLGSYP